MLLSLTSAEARGFEWQDQGRARDNCRGHLGLEPKAERAGDVKSC